jgi:hypothetical protein
MLSTVCRTVNAAGQEFAVWAIGDSEIAIKRMISCAIIALMPEEGMDEVVQSLKDIFEFRVLATQQMLPQQTIGRPIEGKIVRALHRPDLVIPE